MYFSKWRRTYRYAVSSPDPGDSQTDILQQYVAVELYCEVHTDFDFTRKFKEGAGDLRRKVAHLFAFNDDQDPAITCALL
jgi:tyrosinase